MRKLWLSLAALAFAGSTASAQNIVQNPGFESGLASWTVSASDHPWTVVNSNPHSGSMAASTGCVGAQCITGPAAAQLYQDLVTQPGQSYFLSYWFLDAGMPYELQVLWGGSVVQDLTNDSNNAYRLFTASPLVASGASTRLEFRGRQDPSFDRLDDVSVTALDLDGDHVNAVPEPGSLALLGTGLVGMFNVVRRRKVIGPEA